MDVGRNSKGKWRVVGRKAVKVVKLCKKLEKPAAKLLKKAFGSICRASSSSTAPARPAQHSKDDDQAFMFCILQAKTSKLGWERSIIALFKNCKGVRFQMDGDGRVEVSAIGDPSTLLKKIARSSKVKQLWFQFSQCSANLFPPPQPQPQPQPAKKEEKQPPLQRHNININNKPPRLPTDTGGGGGYGLGYQYPPRPHPRIFW